MRINNIKYLLLSLLCVLMASCSWVGDDIDNCPKGQWLKLEYTYNMLDADAAFNHIDDATINIYKHKGDFVKQIKVNKDQLTSGKYLIEVSDLPEGDYHAVVWSGINENQHEVSSVESYEDFRLNLITEKYKTMSNQLDNLYYGAIDSFHVDRKYAVHNVSMMKDTNQLICLVESESEDKKVSTNNYAMELYVDNISMDADNDIIPTNSYTLYYPYSAENVTIEDADFGERKCARFAFSTLRLMEYDNARLVLKLKDTDYEVFNIPVTDYIAQIASLTELNGEPLTPQEYLDRQDQFTFVFYLSATDSGNMLIRCRVNNWVLRSKENVKL